MWGVAPPSAESRVVRLIARIGALAVALSLVAGVPLLLMAFHRVPDLGWLGALLRPRVLRHDLTRGISDTAVLSTLWTAVWLAWIWLVVSVIIQCAGRVRGRTYAPVLGFRHAQRIVSYLVGVSLTLGSPARAALPLRFQGVSDASVMAARQPLAPNQAAGEGFAERGGQGSAAEPRPVGAQVTSDPVPTYTVQPRDTLWSIAERELDSPLRWRAIASYNYGRPQADGLTLTDDHWIQPGWILVMPPSAVGSEEGDAGPVGNGQPATALDMAQLRERSSRFGGRQRSSARSYEATTEVVPVRHDPNLDVSVLKSIGVRSPSGGKGSTGHLPVAPIGYGLLGAGIVAVLDRMRRAQQRQRPTGLRIALPEGDLVELERGLRIAADPESVEFVDLSLRLLSASVQREHIPPPSVVGVKLTDYAVEVMLDEACEAASPPHPFEFGVDGTSWILKRTACHSAALRKNPDVAGHDAPLPSLVTLGRDRSGIFMVNIERAGSVAVSGDQADPIVQGVAIELATASWADQIDLVLVGFGDHEERLERVSYGSSLRAVETRLDRRTRERKALLELAHSTSNPATRWLDEIDPWDVCVVVCAPEVAEREREAAQAIARLAGDGSFGVAFVCGCDLAAARWRVHSEAGQVTIERDGGETMPSLSPQQVPPNLVESVTSLVSVASKTGGVEPEHGPYEGLALPIPERPQQISSASGGSGDWGSGPPGDGPSVEVRVLGPVEIVGAARPFARAWTTELVVYLVMHPGGTSNEQWATALWPERAMAPASLHSTASAARRALGSDAEGEDHLPRSRGRLALGPSVRSDWDELVGRSRSNEPADWRRTLELIRGRPFEGMRCPDWVLLEGIQATIEAVVVDLACRLAEYCLSAFDAPGAEWAARQGLRVSPYDERMYRVLMRSADAAGNPAGVEAIMAELVHLVADDVEPFDAVHPETLALYRSLSRRSTSSRARMN